MKNSIILELTKSKARPSSKGMRFLRTLKFLPFKFLAILSTIAISIIPWKIDYPMNIHSINTILTP